MGERLEDAQKVADDLYAVLASLEPEMFPENDPSWHNELATNYAQTKKT